MYPKELKYSKEHEWVKVDGSKAKIGITHYAQIHLGDVVFVELPNVGETYEIGDSLGVIESVKAVSDVFSPVSGDVLEVNEELETSPELINSDPYNGAWLAVIELSDPDQLNDLLTASEYEEFIEEFIKEGE